VEAAGIELCVAFLLGAAVGYAIRAAISSIRRANIRRRREEYALSHSARADWALDHQVETKEPPRIPPAKGAARRPR
jgi:hypothetical protein